MSYKKLTINYSEDLGENKIIGKVYSCFRDNDIKPLKVSVTYNVVLGKNEANFEFLAQDEYVPTDERLEKILKELNLKDFEIKEEK